MSRAVSAPGRDSATLWTVPGGTTIQELKLQGTTFRGLAFSPDGRWLVGLCDESFMRVWDSGSGRLDQTVRLAVRPEGTGDETADLTFDKDFTRVAVTTGTRRGVWDLRNGNVIEPMRPLTDGQPLRDGYLLRPRTAGKGTFSFFKADRTLRASLLTVSEDGEASSWCLNDDRTLLAVAVKRKVQVWRLKYPTQ
jgi:WD40 repeat protein